MKEWIKKITGKDIKQAYKNVDKQYRTTEEVDKEIINEISKKSS